MVRVSGEAEERRNPQVVTDYSKWFLGRLRAVEAATAKAATLCADRFTAADISVGYALLLAQHLGLHERFTASVMGYWQRLQARGGFQRAMAVQQQAAVAQHVPATPSPDLGPPEPVMKAP